MHNQTKPTPKVSLQDVEQYLDTLKAMATKAIALSGDTDNVRRTELVNSVWGTIASQKGVDAEVTFGYWKMAFANKLRDYIRKTGSKEAKEKGNQKRPVIDSATTLDDIAETHAGEDVPVVLPEPVERAIAWLKENDPNAAAALDLQHTDGYSYEEAGKILGVTQGEFYARVKRAIRTLRKKVAQFSTRQTND